jgi:tRNA modification GTPase
MQKTLERAAEADLFLVVMENGARELKLPDGLDREMTARNTIIILNKSDLHNNESPSLEIPVLQVSALTGAGIDELKQAIIRQIDGFGENVGSEFVAINARHAHALTSATAAFASALDNLAVKGPVELLSSDLRAALAAFGDIAGRIDNERMLDALFETFCIGK